jgi:hypothetical protein
MWQPDRQENFSQSLARSCRSLSPLRRPWSSCPCPAGAFFCNRSELAHVGSERRASVPAKQIRGELSPKAPAGTGKKTEVA